MITTNSTSTPTVQSRTGELLIAIVDKISALESVLDKVLRGASSEKKEEQVELTELNTNLAKINDQLESLLNRVVL